MQRVTLEPTQIHADLIHLTEPQSHYLRRVLRLGEGDRFIALDGQGQGWVASLGGTINHAHILEPWQCDTELPTPIHLIIAMPKTGMDDIVRQATELGVASISPVVSDRTILKPSAKKVDRWRRIAQEAIEQCERQWVPTIVDPIPLVEGLTLPDSPFPLDVTFPNAQQWICVARSTIGETDYSPRLLLSMMLETLDDNIKNQQDITSPIYLAIGPEGGWTPSEVEAAIALGYEPISLGPRILRAVTAPLGAIATIAAALDHYANQR